MPDETQNQTTETNLAEVPEMKPVYITKRSAIIRCVDCEFEPSNKKGNPMFVFTYEIVSPETVDAPEVKDGEPVLGGETVKAIVAGLTTKNYMVLNNKWADANLKDLHRAMGLPMTINKSNPNVNQYKGKAVKCLLSTEVVSQLQEGSTEPLLDDDGKPIQSFNYRIGKLLGGSSQHNVEVAF